jgi:3-oxoisoapionate decarboxylase
VTRLGIGSYAFAWAAGVPGRPRPAAPLDSFGLVALARDLGVRLVQMCDNVPLPGEEDLPRLSAEALRAGVTVELGTRGTEPEHLRRMLDAARVLQSPLVRTLIAAPGSAALAEAEKNVRAVLAAYESAGVTIAIENYEAQKAEELASMVRRCGSPRLGVCLDTVNSLGALEGMDRVLDELLPLAVSIHVKDFTVRRLDHQMGFLIEGAATGTGRLDIPRLLERAAAFAREPGIILEQWTPWQDSLEATVRLERAWAGQGIEHLRRWITS